jgi:serine protease inhibitor
MLSFGLEMVDRLVKESKPEENVIISPLNAYAALLLLHLAAGEKTRSGLVEVLKLSNISPK